MLVKRYLFLLYLLFYSQLSIAEEQLPGFFEVDYNLYSNDTKIGLMERRFFKTENGNYAFTSHSKTTKFIALFRNDEIKEESYWQFNEGGFKPIRYTYQHTGKKKDRNVEIRFDWSNLKITNQVNDSIWYMKTEPGILDKLLYQLTIMSSLKTGNIPESYTIADGGKIKNYYFEYITDEIIKTPIGEFKTMKLARHKNNKDKEAWLWCAYELNFLPIKVVIQEKGDRTTTAIIKSLNGLGMNTSE